LSYKHHSVFFRHYVLEIIATWKCPRCAQYAVTESILRYKGVRVAIKTKSRNWLWNMT